MTKLQVTAGAVLKSDHHIMDEGFEAFIALARTGTVDAGIVTPAIEALRRHIWVEEETFFPPLRQAGVVGPILVMLREHGEIWAHLDELDRVLAQPNPDPELARTVCTGLIQVLGRHNSKEENILYATADRFLDAESIHRVVVDELNAKRPQDWSCAMSVR
jgi:regulator of cell morphogenesis and NO signaling